MSCRTAELDPSRSSHPQASRHIRYCRVAGTDFATVAEEVYMTRSFLTPLAPPPMRFDWSSWIVIATVALLAATLATYFYLD